ncbi:MAG TPA: c-type cytochrome [Burkholderiaceae bacterium]|nr:c-type cytochrome [Burkholderiaceae bacterium]
MSDNSHATVHDEDHTGPIKNPKQLALAVLFSFVAPIFIIIGLVYYVTSANKPAAGSVNVEKAIAERIQKVGSVEIRDANRALKSGEEVFKAQCTACHTAGVAGAPKVGDAGAWGPRIATGYDALLTSALKGKGAMGAQGGGDFEELEIGRAVVYMANGSGGKLAEPKAPAGAADSAAAPAAPPAAAAPAEPAADAASVKVIDGTVKFYFTAGKAELAADGVKALTDILAGVKGGKKALISGFVDPSGDPNKNSELAKVRAFAVKDLLMSSGVTDKQIVMVRPNDIKAGATSAAEGRRVEVSLQ